MTRQARPSRTPNLPTARLLALALPALGLSLVSGSAVAAESPAFFVTRNTADGAVVTASDGTSHEIATKMSAVAGDGSVYVLSAKVTDTRWSAVMVDPATGVGRILDGDPESPNVSIYAGNGAVVVRRDGSFTSWNPATGAATPLAPIPGRPDAVGNRVVTAATATRGGALVTTSDISGISTSAGIYQSDLWKVTAQGATSLLTVHGRYLPALVAHDATIDLVLASGADDSLSHLRLLDDTVTGRSHRAPVTVETPLHVTLTPEVTSAELGYLGTGADAEPALTLTGSGGTSIYAMDGALRSSFTDTAKVYVSSADVSDPTSIVNRLSKQVRLSGVRPGTSYRYGTTVTPVGVAISSGATRIVGPSALQVALRTTRGRVVRGLTSGAPFRLTRTACFTASSGATAAARRAVPVTRCVSVGHRLELVSKNRRVVRLRTTAAKLEVQVRLHPGTRRARWATVRTVRVHHGFAELRAPQGTVRFVAPASTTNTRAALRLIR